MKLRSMEAGRGVAALVVLLSHAIDTVAQRPAMHAGDVFGGYRQPGGPGVEFFFVLSGFVMILAHGRDFGKLPRIGVFIWRRACRIYPMYWIALGCLLWQYWQVPDLSKWRILGMLSLRPGSRDDYLIVAWSLRQEIMFYIMLALAMLPRIGIPILATWIGATLVMGPLFEIWQLPSWCFTVFNPFSVEFFAGMFYAVLLRRWTPPPGILFAILAASVAGILWRLSLDQWGAIYGPFAARIVYGACYGGIIYALAKLEQRGAIRFGRWASIAGSLSYPLYTSHVVVVAWTTDYLLSTGVSRNWSGEALVALMVAAALTVAALATVLIDRPVQRWLRRV